MAVEDDFFGPVGVKDAMALNASSLGSVSVSPRMLEA